MLPNFAVICPRVDAHFSTLSPISPAKAVNHTIIANFLCCLIRWMLIQAIPSIPQINAVLDRVSNIASIHSVINDQCMIAVFLLVRMFFICSFFSLKK